MGRVARGVPKLCTYNLLSQERNAYVHYPHRTRRETSRRNHIVPPSLYAHGERGYRVIRFVTRPASACREDASDRKMAQRSRPHRPRSLHRRPGRILSCGGARVRGFLHQPPCSGQLRVPPHLRGPARRELLCTPKRADAWAPSSSNPRAACPAGARLCQRPWDGTGWRQWNTWRRRAGRRPAAEKPEQAGNNGTPGGAPSDAKPKKPISPTRRRANSLVGVGEEAGQRGGRGGDGQEECQEKNDRGGATSMEGARRRRRADHRHYHREYHRLHIQNLTGAPRPKPGEGRPPRPPDREAAPRSALFGKLAVVLDRLLLAHSDWRRGGGIFRHWFGCAARRPAGRRRALGRRGPAARVPAARRETKARPRPKPPSRRSARTARCPSPRCSTSARIGKGAWTATRPRNPRSRARRRRRRRSRGATGRRAGSSTRPTGRPRPPPRARAGAAAAAPRRDGPTTAGSSRRSGPPTWCSLLSPLVQ